jgi:methionyl aminopeptidase
MIYYKTDAEIELIRESSLLVSETIAKLTSLLCPGVTTLYLDEVAYEFIHDHGGVPSFKGFEGYPFSTCISVNDAVVHGFPTNDALKEGDVVSIDIGVFKNGFHGDSAYTLALKEPAPGVVDLMRATKASLYAGIEKATANNRIGDIAFAIQELTERKNRYGVVRELVGHGLGRELHEEPQIPNYGKRGSGAKLNEGLVIAIEPMVNLGKKDIKTDADGWTIRTRDGKPSAHYEHTLCVRKSKADVLSSFAAIEAAEAANPYLVSGY